MTIKSNYRQIGHVPCNIIVLLLSLLLLLELFKLLLDVMLCDLLSCDCRDVVYPPLILLGTFGAYRSIAAAVVACILCVSLSENLEKRGLEIKIQYREE